MVAVGRRDCVEVGAEPRSGRRGTSTTLPPAISGPPVYTG